MQVGSISNSYSKGYNNRYTKKRKNVNYVENDSTTFKGAKGFILGAVTGGVVASIFLTELQLVYATLGGLLGDWIEDKSKSNNDNDNNNEDNMRNEKNLRFYR